MFKDILEHWEVVQMIQGTLGGILKKRDWLSARQPPPQKLCCRAKIVAQCFSIVRST